jgi:hypothetical protein
MDPDPKFLSEEEAARFWQRAAQLQAEAADRADGLAREPEDEDADADAPEGYALTHVRAAALEAGISEKFMDAALADLQAERALPRKKSGWSLARSILKHPTDTITVRRVIDAAPQDVLAAMQDIFPREPYRLTLSDQKGDLLDGGVLIFDIQGFGAIAPEGLARDAGFSGLRQVWVSLRPIEGATSSCEVTLRGPVAWGYGMGFLQGVLATGFIGAPGVLLGVLGYGLSNVPEGGPFTALAAILIAVGGLVGGGLGVKGYRAAYRFGIRRGRKALEGLLGALAGHSQGSWRITPLGDAEPPPALPGASSPTD